MRITQKLYQTARGRLMLAIPHEAVKEFNLEKDTKVEIDTDKKRGMIIIYIEKENE